MSNMENITKAKQAGNRLRQIRMANGMTQKEVAELVGLTDAAISKYEKNGIPGIDDIQRISDALQEDLLSDTRDIEGVVGEIGKEILRILLENKGIVTMNELVDKLYGLDEKMTSNELGKLERIGLCMREQYFDFHDIEKDKIFITAKGVITFKNNITAGVSQQILDQSNLSTVVTYEQILAKYYKGNADRSSYDNYEELINSRPIEKLIRNLNVKNGYKLDFLKYIQRTYVSKLEEGVPEDEFHKVVPGRSFYADTIYRMITNFKRKNLDDLIKTEKEIIKTKEKIEDIQNDIMYFPSDDLVVDKANCILSDIIPDMDKVLYDIYINDGYEYNEVGDIVEKEPSYIDNLDVPKMNQEGKDFLYDLQQDLMSMETAIVAYVPSYHYEYQLEEKSRNSPYPTDWFTLEECDEYVRSQMLVEEDSEYSREVDELINKAFELDPNCKEYFVFPEEWEKSGLAQAVRNYYGVR